MSFSFVVPRSTPDESLLKQVGARYRRLTAGDASGWIAWRGAAARGVYVYADDGDARFKLPTCASADDAALAMELAVTFARRQGLPIDAEEPPSEFERDPALARPSLPGYGREAFLFDADEVGAWPEDWHVPHTESGIAFVGMQLREGVFVSLSGPFRRTLVGPRFLGRAFAGLSQAGEAELRRVLLRAVAVAQGEAVASLPTLPRFLTDTRAPSGAEWSPSPSESVSPARALEGDIAGFRKERRGYAHYVPVRAGGTFLLPMADYVALRESDTTWFAVPFATFEAAAGRRLSWLDEFTAVVETRGDDFPAIVEQCRPAKIASVMHAEVLVQDFTPERLAALMAGASGGGPSFVLTSGGVTRRMRTWALAGAAFLGIMALIHVLPWSIALAVAPTFLLSYFFGGGAVGPTPRLPSRKLVLGAVAFVVLLAVVVGVLAGLAGKKKNGSGANPPSAASR